MRLVVVDDLQDFDEAERGPQPPKRRVLVGIDRHRRLPRRRIVQPGTQMQVHSAALPLDLIVILGRAEGRGSEQRCCFEDRVCDGAR